MRINKEEMLLNEDFRLACIKDFNSKESIARKEEAKKRYEIFKDQSKKYVLEAMCKESADGKNILPEIESRASGVSFARKIIDKKAMVYKNPVSRTHSNQEALDDTIDLLNVDNTMKKANKYVELFKNTLIHVFPWLDKTINKYKIALRVLAPYSYDVIEDMENPETIRAVVYSYETGERTLDGKPALNYIWWSTAYHFTTNNKGQIIELLSPENNLNPIQMLPFVDIAEDKDSCYWAKGGDDIINCDVLLNIAITDLNYIIKYQSMGIFYLAGAGVPKSVKVGPSSMIVLEKREGDPDMQIGFASSNPQIDAVLSSIEQYLNFVLSTNSLDAGSISGRVTAAAASSGLQEMIKRSELLDDIQDQQEIYRDAEPVMFTIIFKFINLYLGMGQLADEFAEIGNVDEDEEVITKFAPPSIIQTELDKLAVIEKRKSLGLDSEIDTIMLDNPEMSKEDAIKKLAEIKKEKAESAVNAMTKSVVNKEDDKEEDKAEEKEEIIYGE
jgi:hypothetical protein